MADVSNGETRESANEIEDNINVGSRQLDDVSDADASSVDVSATTVTVADVNGEHESDSTTPPNKIPSDTVGVENSSGKDETSTTEAVPRDTHEEEVDTTKQAEIKATTIDESTASNTDSRTEPPKTIDNIENGVIYYDIDDSPSIYVDERVSDSAGDTVGALESNDDDGSADTTESTQLDSKEVDPSGLESDEQVSAEGAGDYSDDFGNEPGAEETQTTSPNESGNDAASMVSDTGNPDDPNESDPTNDDTNSYDANSIQSDEANSTDSESADDIPDEGEDGPKEHVLVDYASKLAGAQILEKSPSLKGTSNLLTGDIDKYAIAPCEEKKYVVIGLSEDILVKRIKLSNYERYSSHVREFQVLASQEYPAPSEYWNDLGTYTALSKSGEQTFELNEPAWARYLKFRFMSHYGKEHYCTLSQIKVHGSTMLQGFHEQWIESEKKDRELAEDGEVGGEQEGGESHDAETEMQGLQEYGDSVVDEIDGEESEEVFDEEDDAFSESAVMEEENGQTQDEEQVAQPTGDSKEISEDASRDNESVNDEDITLHESVEKSGDVEPQVASEDSDSLSTDVDIVVNTNQIDDASSTEDEEKPVTANIEREQPESPDVVDAVQRSDSTSQDDASETTNASVDHAVSRMEEGSDGGGSASTPLSNHDADENATNNTTDDTTTQLDTEEAPIDSESVGEELPPTDSIHVVTDAVKAAVADATVVIKHVKEVVQATDTVSEIKKIIRTTIGISDEDNATAGDSQDDMPPSTESNATIPINDTTVDAESPAKDTTTDPEVEENEDASSEVMEQTVAKAASSVNETDSTNVTQTKTKKAEGESKSSTNTSAVAKAESKSKANTAVVTGQPKTIIPANNNVIKKEASTDKLVAKLSIKYPCMKHLDFQSFKAAKSLIANASPGSGAMGGAKMEPIFAKITHEIKSVQSMQHQYEQYISSVKACYDKVLLDLVNDIDSIQTNFDGRLAILERTLLETARETSPTAAALVDQGALMLSFIPFTSMPAVYPFQRISDCPEMVCMCVGIAVFVLLLRSSFKKKLKQIQQQQLGDQKKQTQMNVSAASVPKQKAARVSTPTQSASIGKKKQTPSAISTNHNIIPSEEDEIAPVSLGSNASVAPFGFEMKGSPRDVPHSVSCEDSVYSIPTSARSEPIQSGLHASPSIAKRDSPLQRFKTKILRPGSA